MNSIGSRLNKYRVAKNLSMEQLANLSGVSQSTISTIEADNQSPRIATLNLLCAALNIRVIDIIEETDLSSLTTEQIKLLSVTEKLESEELSSLTFFLELILRNNQR